MTRALIAVCAVLCFVNNTVSAQNTVEIRLIRVDNPCKSENETELLDKATIACSIAMSIFPNADSFAAARIGHQEIEATVHLHEKKNRVEMEMTACHSVYHSDRKRPTYHQWYSSSVPAKPGSRTVLGGWREGNRHFYFVVIMKKKCK